MRVRSGVTSISRRGKRFAVWSRVAWAAVLCALAAAAPAGAQTLVTPSFVPYTTLGQFYDYRPAVNAAGTKIVFERSTIAANGSIGPTHLYIADLANPVPTPLVSALAGSRPDWCWRETRKDTEGPIAFTAFINSSSATGTYIVTPTTDPANAPYSYVRDSGATIYPTWYPACKNLAVDAVGSLPVGVSPSDSNDPSSGAQQNPGPSTQRIDAATGRLERSLSGRKIWSGFMSIDPRDPTLLALAGQPFYAVGTYGPPAGSPGQTCAFKVVAYDQDCNYIYIADTSSIPSRVVPLDRDASVNTFQPAHQGRAPSWSPDGKWIAFESNRACVSANGKSPNYAIFLEDARGRTPAVQVTDCSFDAQHAKWFRQPVNGRVLIIATLAYLQKGAKPQARGIATLDVTALVTK